MTAAPPPAGAAAPTGTMPLARAGERTAIRVDLTPRAARQVRSLLAARAGAQHGLRVSVDQTQSGEPAYRLSLAPQPHPSDLVLPRNGFDVFAPAQHRARLDGVRIDFVELPASAGFVVDPPGRSPRPRSLRPRSSRPGGTGSGEVPGPPEVVAAVEAAIAQVRPALRSDGGDVGLVAVEGRTAYVSLAGACSGCSSALNTLTGLVERVIVDLVPEIDRVVLAS